MSKNGLPQILIPIKQRDLTINAILPYFPTILAQFQKNAEKIRKNYDIYCLSHEILNKHRQHDDNGINNKVLEPHIKNLVEWKTGYIIGNPIKYAQSKDTKTDDLEYLNRYVRHSNKRTIDQEVLTWVYATGVGYYFIEPKPNDEEVDLEEDSPFDLFCKDADTCAKVYSAYNGKKPLFDFLFTKIEEIGEDNKPKEYCLIDLYLPNEYYSFKIADITKEPTLSDVIDKKNRLIYKKLPLVEKRLLNGIGIVEVVNSLQTALDKVASNNLDNLEDFTNILYKYKNVSLGDSAEEKIKTHRSIVKNGAVEIKSDPGIDADVEIEQVKPLDLRDVESFSDKLTDVMYSTVGVPRPTSNTNSGGTTKQGSETANGYENAYNRALADINSYSNADRQLLENMLFICKAFPDNKIDKLKSSQIEIKYCLNLTDNMLIKSQSAGTLYNINMPKSLILEKCKLSNDPEAEGKLWEENDKAKIKEMNDKKVVEDIDVKEPKAQ